MILSFPPLELATPEGLVAIGGDLEVSSLKLAYSQGIFPWPHEEEAPMMWYSPDPRGVLFYKDLHVPQSLRKTLKSKKFTVTYNTCFEKVIEACAKAKRSDNQSTWITSKMREAYIDLFHAGFAYSVEVFLETKLVGGIYGVKLSNYVSGESMFYLVSNASKVALVTLMERLYAQGIEWLDTQMVTPVVASLGGKEIARKDFLNLLKKSQF